MEKWKRRQYGEGKRAGSQRKGQKEDEREELKADRRGREPK